MSSNGDKELEMVGLYIVGFFKKINIFFRNLFVSFKMIKKKKTRLFTLLVLIAVAVLIYFFKDYIWSIIPEGERLSKLKYAVYLSPLIPIMYLYWLGEDYYKEIDNFDNMFEEIGFYGKGKKKKTDFSGKTVESKAYPKFLSKTEDGKVVKYSFYSAIPLLEWRTRKEDLETVLDCNIFKIVNTKKSKKVVVLHTVPTEDGLKAYVPWSDEYIRETDFEITVGAGLLDDVVFDLNKVPHALIAGVTGSGKSVLLRCILWQCINKGAKIYMLDFKGGVEFGKQYEQFGEVVTDHQRALKMLKELTRENKARLELFREMGVKNLGEYNEIADKKLCRVVVLCDEVAEMLDKTGLSKEDKKIYSEIEKEMSTLARLSRATGINMMMGTQRPDARVIPGQIKNNLPIRISGRMVDSQASEMVLGNTKAALIDDTRGRFMYNIGADTFEFQAYYFDDNVIKSGNYVKGGMLTIEDEDIASDAESTEDEGKITFEKSNVKPTKFLSDKTKVSSINTSDVEFKCFDEEDDKQEDEINTEVDVAIEENNEELEDDYKDDYEDDFEPDIDMNDHDLYGELVDYDEDEDEAIEEDEDQSEEQVVLFDDF